MVSISKLFKPLNFTPWPVTILTTLIYVALLTSILVVHTVVPSAPKNPVPLKGVNTSEAWADLQFLTNGFRPYNSRRNDEIRDWLLRRIEAILAENGILPVSGGTELNRQELFVRSVGQDLQSSTETPSLYTHDRFSTSDEAIANAIIYNDLVSNVTFSSEGKKTSAGRPRSVGQSVYFEGTNIIVYIPGSEDGGNQSSLDVPTQVASHGPGGVLVNAHYDSVSTGFGATDDGVGVITSLQLIKYYTTPGNTPKKGLVVLLNNGEEDFLNGARVFTQHPMSNFPRVFLNLEGAGAGGRATLFRSTDTEVTKFYARSPYPFGTVMSADGFKRGLIRSQTDYVVFNGILGLRGLDVAFMEPRARYHTDQDDTRHTSIASLWHMLSAALATTKGLTSDTSSTFDRPNDDISKSNEAVNGSGSEGVWFDLYGRALAVFRLRTLFAISVTLLVITPLIVLVFMLALSKVEKMYFFSNNAYQKSSSSNREPLSLYGWRGFVRFPLTLIVSAAATIGLAFLIAKVNPFIIYSSPYAVWGMMMSSWIFIFWFCLSLADFIRPSALYRGYALMWMFLLGWIGLVAVTVLEDRYKIAGGYPMVFYFCGISLGTFLTFLECLALPRKSEYAKNRVRHRDDIARQESEPSSTLIAPSAEEQTAIENPSGYGEEEEPTEATPLFRDDRRTTFAHYARPGEDPDSAAGVHSATPPEKANGQEQQWAGALNHWTWLLQMLLLGPINVILLGQVGLLLTSAISQTGADGNSSLFIYVAIAFLVILILLPLSPFLHRFTYHIPTALLVVFVGTLTYNLVAFPFSANNRYKVYFMQEVDLETGINSVSLSGINPFVQQIISNVPSAAGQHVKCSNDTRGKAGLTKCVWKGLPPKVVPNMPAGTPPELGYLDWLHYNVSRDDDGTGTNQSAVFHLYGRNTRACKLVFNKPISDFSVEGAARDGRFRALPEEVGSKEIRLWRREWERPWDVHVKWSSSLSDGDNGDDDAGKSNRSMAEKVDEGSNGEEKQTGMDGKVVCLWSDANETGVIPALDELRRYLPDWVAITKLTDGLVEGYKRFMI